MAGEASEGAYEFAIQDKIANVNNNMCEIVQGKQREYSFPKRQAIDVRFDNITFQATQWSFRKFQKETKQILHGVSGTFKSGDLTVIMGPSGAGKSTLLNILAGFVARGSSGEVRYNDVIRTNSPRFRKLSAYIPQDEELRLGLTVHESMTFAANLKLGYSVTHAYKRQQVVEILEILGLDGCHNTMTSRLSGGQKKRLAVALELLSNPPILFLDEPTTGLDSASCTQTVTLLKNLARDGRTVVCTIHQPSALLFELFDRLYSVAEGNCIYNGSVRDLVPYLSNMGLVCPAYHNPADFLMEVAVGEHGTDVQTLARAAKVQALQELEETKEKKLLDESVKWRKSLMSSYLEDVSPLPAAVIMQFLLLYKRNLLENKRGYMYLFNRLLAHIFIGLIFGYLYRGVGSKANTILGNYVYMYGTLLLVVYTGQMSVMLSFPLEMKVLTREHFNRWYKLSPYILSVVLIDIPFQVLCCWLYLSISYYLTEQPTDFRMYLFVLFATSSTLCAQAWGYFFGASIPMKIAVFIGPVVACLFSIFGFCITYINTPVIFRWMYYISYYRAGFHGIVYSIYGMHRKYLPCPDEEVYCHYSNPNTFLQEMDVVDVDLVSNLSVIVAIWCIMHAATYLSLWLKLTKR
ncbi:ATP-binding cassette sub-family G member 1 isoform X2 [Coccinella septempunctata]|uniref:ATP-binding cassette sub-family G member 1 isoform X2 n=1 Tax=Coccinella septempunctata TaxID=41139 RepID=UPI001D076AA8|nr:ATP-binding cassette sub-family G member 1 isoform X2 [Coccinella septempunctata]